MLKHSIMVMALAMGTAAMAQEAQPQPPMEQAQPTPVAPARPEAAPPVTAGNDEATATQKLAANGYTEVQGLVRQGNEWRGTAMRDGKRVQVTVAPDGTTRHTPLG